MVFSLTLLIITPIIFAIVTYPPFEGYVEEQAQEIRPLNSEYKSKIFSYLLIAILPLILIRILYQVKKRNFKIRI